MHHPIDIRHVTQLRSITFMLGAVNQSRWVTEILSHISSARLEDVTFTVHCSNWCRRGVHLHNVSNALEWRNVDAVLQHSTFSGLRNVHFRCNFPLSDFGWGLESLASVVQHLPLCHARGIFHVDEW
jgi:hypothetical protein